MLPPPPSEPPSEPLTEQHAPSPDYTSEPPTAARDALPPPSLRLAELEALVPLLEARIAQLEQALAIELQRL
jgi:hypothetical protein